MDSHKSQGRSTLMWGDYSWCVGSNGPGAAFREDDGENSLGLVFVLYPEGRLYNAMDRTQAVYGEKGGEPMAFFCPGLYGTASNELLLKVAKGLAGWVHEVSDNNVRCKVASVPEKREIGKTKREMKFYVCVPCVTEEARPCVTMGRANCASLHSRVRGPI